MRWFEVQQTYPDQWLVIEAVQAHSEAGQRILDKISIVETCPDGSEAFQRYRNWHQQYPEREFYYVHTSRDQLDIRERQWLGVRRGSATATPR